MTQRNVVVGGKARIAQRTNAPQTREGQRKKDVKQARKDADQLKSWGEQSRQPRVSKKVQGKVGSIGGKLFANQAAERKSIKASIKGNEHLIHRYSDLIDPEHSTQSFEIHKARLDKERDELQIRYDFLQGMYDKASNGEIPSLIQQQVELEKKLSELRKKPSTLKQAEAYKRRLKRKVERTNRLREKLTALEEELKGASTQEEVQEIFNTVETG